MINMSATESVENVYVHCTGADLQADRMAEPVYGDIRRERQRQAQQWGGTEHDDLHSQKDWLRFIDKQREAGMQGPDYRERLVKIAALAVAAIESYDREASK